MTSIRMKAIPILCAMAWMLALPAMSGAMEEADAPPALRPWASWVLDGHETEQCPSPFDNPELHHCRWPSRLSLDLNDAGGRFSQDWSLFDDLFVPLPGGAGQWPVEVLVDGRRLPLVGRDGAPHVHLPEGEHHLTGTFSWDAIPEMIRIPEATGLVDVRIHGELLAFPRREPDGRLWLKKRELQEDREDRLEIKVTRLLRDTIPMEVVTQLDVRVSGRPREISLEGLFPEGAVPMRMESGIPARMDSEGSLVLQVRPGRWAIEIVSRMEGPIHEIGPVRGSMGREIWSFEPRNHLRMVKVEGVSAVDPTQADVPSQWRSFPAYEVRPGDTVRFREIRRGDPEPGPDRLHMERTWWLDFDGAGYTIHDRITGNMIRNWSLAMNPPTELGRVQVDGKDQLITKQGGGDDTKAGVEVRRGNLHLTADSRFEASTSHLPLVGWDHDFQSVSAVLHLPPGWRLLTARGVDVIPGTWFERWTLLDLFLVLIIAVAVWKLRGRPWGLVALVCVGLIYHEPDSPRMVWLHLLASMALLKLISGGWFRRLVQAWFLGAVVSLLVFSIPFMVQQARIGLYPQLETPGSWETGGIRFQGMKKDVAPAAQEPLAGAAREGEAITGAAKSVGRYAGKSEVRSSALKQTALVQDPDALIQTGPGLPSWSWRTVSMGWNGPVDRHQEIRLWLLSPRVNGVLCFLHVGLLAILITALIGKRPWVSMRGAGAGAAILLLMVLLPQPAGAEPSAEGGFPSKWLLEEFERRLLEPEDCYPRCADMAKMVLEAGDGKLTLGLEVHAAAHTAVPLPGGLNTWSPDRVLMDGRTVPALLRDAEGRLWGMVPQGIHMWTLHGNLAEGRPTQLSLPLRPRRAVIQARGWDVRGVHSDGTVEGTLLLTPERVGDDAASPELGGGLPPLLQITRTLHLGLTWEVDTEVRRVTPPGTPVVVAVPLIQGESVHTEGVPVEKGEARVHMGPDDTVLQWVSSLEPAEKIRLRAAEDVPWTEVWILDAGPVWHCDAAGIPVIHHQDGQGFWKPEWRPWPGEEVTIAVTRPKAMPGPSTTRDEAHLSWTAGKRFDKGVLTLTVRTSRGGRQRIDLPDQARLQVVKIDGKSLPVRMQDGTVVIPLTPGRQTAQVEWYQESDAPLMTTAPLVGLGGPAVNARVTYNMPRNRWVLWAEGPRLGPSVLFWTYLVVVMLAAVALGRVSWTPLKTRHWVLMGLGLTQVHPLVAIGIVGWFLVMGLRRTSVPTQGGGAVRFNALQVLLVIWTAAAFVGMYAAVQKGLLGIPDMQIAGNGSTALALHWTQDRIQDAMPQPWVVSVPLLVFRILMLLWALWLAFSLTRWLGWAWTCFSEGGIWRAMRKRKQAANDPGTFEFQEE